MGASTSLHTNQARIKFFKESKQVMTPNLPREDRRALRIRAVHLKDLLCQIESYS
ncbi:Hypothetical protein NGAL_HAMBI490_47840 [Neorhizobium galegae bv. officinalis]|nr:Hypothetical protein NGAL_HAMBI490_47840 [Neorhizobium galegae bv. officinalis]